jgi:hypothetical protein
MHRRRLDRLLEPEAATATILDPAQLALQWS